MSGEDFNTGMNVTQQWAETRSSQDFTQNQNGESPNKSELLSVMSGKNYNKLTSKHGPKIRLKLDDLMREQELEDDLYLQKKQSDQDAAEEKE